MDRPSGGATVVSDLRKALCFDVGGTYVKAGVIDEAGHLLGLVRSATAPSPEESVQALVRTTHDLLAQAGLSQEALSGVGVSVAAFITAAGRVKATAHLGSEWVGYDLRARLAQDLPLPAYFALDTPAPTLGEAYFGAGRGARHFVYVTVSTGIGAGIMADGKYVIGGLGWAGGVGHCIVDPHSNRVCSGCGNAGCLETFAAKQGIVTTAAELIAANPSSLMAALTHGEASEITPALVTAAAQQGDETAIEVYRRAGSMLGIGLTYLANIVSPERIVVGGGISQAGDLLLEPARAVVRRCSFPPDARRVEIVQAELGDLSGIYGAAAMVFQDIRVNPD